MPKSRGRQPTRRKPPPGRRPAPRTPAQAALREAERLLAPTTDRCEAESAASIWLGAAEFVGPFDTTATASARLADAVVAAADKRRSPGAAAALAALATVVDHPGVRAGLDDWASALLVDHSWVREPAPELVAAWRSDDAWEDITVIFLDYGSDVIMTLTSRVMGQFLTAGLVGPEAMTVWESQDVPMDVLREVSTVEAVGLLQHRLFLTDHTTPPLTDERFLEVRAVLAARLRATGIEPVDDENEPLSDAERDELLDAFFGDTGVPDDDITRELADLCLLFGDSHLPGHPLAWAPTAVERFLLDWAPRKTLLDDERVRLLPTVTYAWVGWALLRQGVSPNAATDAAQVALDLRDQAREAYDEAEKSPATQVVSWLQDEGVDLTDQNALQAALQRFNDAGGLRP
ncbi:MAG: hypothetical protein JWL64_281 [Frankiales bacterium]|nr:hypothetical protein [Frankiales bacterium]